MGNFLTHTSNNWSIVNAAAAANEDSIEGASCSDECPYRNKIVKQRCYDLCMVCAFLMFLNIFKFA